MAKTITEKEFLELIFKVIPSILSFPYKKMWIDYDENADVLYISFKRPQQATDTEMTKDGILIRYKDDDIVGITILEASKRSGNVESY
jgi:uncharacterized protein YuzE